MVDPRVQAAIDRLNEAKAEADAAESAALRAKRAEEDARHELAEARKLVRAIIAEQWARCRKCKADPGHVCARHYVEYFEAIGMQATGGKS